MKNPFALALDVQRRTWEGAAEFAEKSGVAPDRAETLNEVEVGQTPSEVVYEENKLELLHYEPRTDEQHDVPILVTYALINKPYILDLQPDRSVIKTLLEEGFDVYMIDWNEPSELDRSLTLDDYVSRYIDNCVDVVRERSGQDSINILGYCMGGTMSVMYASLFPEKVRNLGLMAAGLCFDDTGGVLELWGGDEFYDPETVTETFDNVPAGFLDVGFALMDPVANNVTKYVRFYDNVEDEDFVENFARMEAWLSDGIDVAGKTYEQFIRDIYQGNKLYENELYLDGTHVDLENIDMPVLNIVAEYDHLIPPAASKPFNEKVASEDTTVMEFATGHIGMSVSSRSHAELWPDVSEWFEQRSNGEVSAEPEEPEPAEADAALAEDAVADETGAEDLTDGGSAVEVDSGSIGDDETAGEAAESDAELDAATDSLGDDPSESEIVERSDDDVQEEPAEPGELTVDEDVADELVEEDLGDDEDDLTDLSGVGRAYAEDLHEAGIRRFDQLAAADAEALAERTGIAESRIEDWIEQVADR